MTPRLDTRWTPSSRPRRLRRVAGLRRLAREHRLSTDGLIYPLFVCEGQGVREEIVSMPGQFHLSLDQLAEEAEGLQALGVPAVLLFGLPGHKDDTASAARDPEGIVPRAVHVLKAVVPELVVMTDVCACAYADHGHCGVVRDGEVLNDESLELLAEMAVAHGRAGADVVAPSAMMDGQVGAIRAALDGAELPEVAILAYAAKYASAFYGPFRDAAGSAPGFGDRASYQMDPANAREARREIALDLAQGADAVMVKPALAYLDVIRTAREISDVPVAAYNVSGEYAMVKAAAERGWVDERKTVLETLTAMKRAGADWLITYWAKDVAGWLDEPEGSRT